MKTYTVLCDMCKKDVTEYGEYYEQFSYCGKDLQLCEQCFKALGASIGVEINTL